MGSQRVGADGVRQVQVGPGVEADLGVEEY